MYSHNTLGDITVHLPQEHLDDLSKVIEMGLQRAKLSQEARANLASWWEAERGMIAEELAEKEKSEL